MTIGMNPLGTPAEYPESYDASLLFPILRRENRILLGLDGEQVPFWGYDLWRAYELSWLDLRGKPVAAIGEFLIPSSSPCMVESKSFKLYLNSLNQERYANTAVVQSLIARDVSAVAGAQVLVQLYSLSAFSDLQCAAPQGQSLDALNIAVDTYSPTPALLMTTQKGGIEEALYSNLFRSNCPVTAQPDWGTVSITYRGEALCHDSLLRYLVSYRNHNGFHEDCAEQIYLDVMRLKGIEQLSVRINFLRRGGLEINPFRSSSPACFEFPALRLLRQ